LPKHFTANVHRPKVAIKSNEQTFVELLALYRSYMKPLPHSSHLKAALLLIQVIMCFGNPTVAQAGDKVSSFCRPVGPELDYRTELPQGYLIVYSATDTFDDGDMPYYAHSAYSIYTANEKFFKHVENHISLSDEIPSLVTLATGSYTIEARSESRGYVRVPVVIAAGRRTVVDPDREQTVTQKRLAGAKHSRRLADL
jgi:hypothetical protein